MVQTVEYILEKCDEDGSDPYLGLFSYRVTPISPHLESSSVLLNNRKFKTTLPMAARSRVNDTTSKTKKELYLRQVQQAFYYNRNAGPSLKPLEQGQPVNIYDHHSRTWERGAVLRPVKEPRSYIVKNDKTGSIYRRTRVQLRPIKQQATFTIEKLIIHLILIIKLIIKPNLCLYSYEMG